MSFAARTGQLDLNFACACIGYRSSINCEFGWRLNEITYFTLRYINILTANKLIYFNHAFFSFKSTNRKKLQTTSKTREKQAENKLHSKVPMGSSPGP